MPSSITQIRNFITTHIKGYAVTAFQNLQMQRALLMLLDLIATAVAGGTLTVAPGTYVYTSADFISATECPVPALDGQSIIIFWNDTPKYLTEGTDWSAYPGGGFQILIPDFDSATATFTFYVTLKAN